MAAVVPVSGPLPLVLVEEALVRRREAERVRGEFWSGAANYFDRMERANGRFASWTSDQSYKARYVLHVEYMSLI